MTTIRAALLLVCVLCLLVPPAARPALLTWEGTLSLDLLDPSLGTPSIAGSGVAVVWPDGDPALHTLRLRGGLTGSAVFPVTDPGTPGLAAVVLSAGLGIGTLAPFHPPAPFPAPQLGSNTLPLPGVVRLCFVTPDCANGELAIPLLGPDGGVGVGGLVTAGGAGPIRVSLEAAPWTVATAWLPVETSGGGTTSLPGFGFVHGPASFTGSTANPGGALQLVTPIAVSSNQAPAPSGFGVLRLRFVPEPDVWLLLASGVGGLLLLARNRVRP